MCDRQKVADLSSEEEEELGPTSIPDRTQPEGHTNTHSYKKSLRLSSDQIVRQNSKLPMTLRWKLNYSKVTPGRNIVWLSKVT